MFSWELLTKQEDFQHMCALCFSFLQLHFERCHWGGKPWIIQSSLSRAAVLQADRPCRYLMSFWAQRSGFHTFTAYFCPVVPQSTLLQVGCCLESEDRTCFSHMPPLLLLIPSSSSCCCSLVLIFSSSHISQTIIHTTPPIYGKSLQHIDYTNSFCLVSSVQQITGPETWHQICCRLAF